MSRAAYFSKLNYTLANEDSGFERAIVPEFAKNILCVCGSGSRVLPLFTKSIESMTIVDLVDEQLWLAELRVEALRKLSREDFLELFGYTNFSGSEKKRNEIIDDLRLNSDAKKFWIDHFKRTKEPLIYQGKWEKSFAKIAKINSLVTGSKGAKLFDLEGEDYYNYLEQEFPWKKWSLVLALLGNASFFNALLYKGEFPRANYPGSSYAFYSERFRKLFNQAPANHNYLLQLLFFGAIKNLKGLPTEVEEVIYLEAQQKARETSVEYRKGDVIRVSAELGNSIDFLSFSDVPSYYKGTFGRDYLQAIKNNISIDGMVVVRYYQYIPWRCDTTDYINLTGNFKEQIEKERTQVYDIDILVRGK